MKMRRGLEGIADKNKTDIEQMLSLLETKAEFDIAILYGRYAGGRMRHEQGGYELLLLTQGAPTHDGWELEAYLRKEYPLPSRADWNLHIETENINTFNRINTASWFFWNIRNEGTIIYDSGKIQGIFHDTHFKHIKAYKLARSQYDYFFSKGGDMLDEAERLWGEEKQALAAIMLSYAAQFLLRAQEAVFYGNFIPTSDLQKSFRRARGFSSKLIKAFRRKSCSETPFFAQLMELRHAPRKHIDFVLAKRRYNMFLGKLRTMQDIIRDSCERHLFYLQHGKTKSQMEAEAAAQTTAYMSGSELLGTDDTAVGVEPAANLGADTTGRPGVGTETDEMQGISIHVDPTIAVIALGLAKGCLPGMLEQLESQSGLRMEDDRRQQMIDTLDEIYNRCIEKSDIREVVDMYLKTESEGTVS